MKKSPTVIYVLTTAVLCSVALRGSGDEPTPTATPTPTPTAQAGTRSLSEVAGDIKLDKDAAGKDGAIVIDNETLSDLAGKGRLTEVTRTGPVQGQRELADVSGTGAGVEGEAAGFAATEERKQYWQALYQQQLDLVTSIRKQIDLLDGEIPGLWRDYYAWDDPAYRDGVIKPKLDEALAHRQKLEIDQQEAEAKLAQVQEDARRDGAQPGWWRGFDKPPTPVPTRGVMPP